MQERENCLPLLDSGKCCYSFSAFIFSSVQRRNKLSQIYRRQTFAHYHQPKTLEFLEKDAVRDNENISFWHWRHFLTAAPPPRCGGGGGAREVAYFLNFPGGAVVFFIISGRQRSEFQTIKTGLNCWQVTRHWGKPTIRSIVALYTLQCWYSIHEFTAYIL